MALKETIRYADVQDIIVASQQAPGGYPPHWHNAAEFTLALLDGCSYRIGDTLYTLNQGDILLVWPRELHETVYAGENAAFFVQFSDRLLEDNRDLSAALRTLSRLRMVSRQDQPELSGRVTALLKELRRQYASEGFFRETRCKLCIYQILLLLGEHAHMAKIRQLQRESFSSEAWERVQAACRYIADHYTESISLNQVADAVGLSPYYFSRLFSQYMQSSFPQYVAHIRVRRAARLLGGTGLSITDCAYQAGFQSITAFNKNFLEIVGAAPREYRRLYRNIQAEAEGNGPD